ncbi:MAG: hypothetical protein ACJAZ2_001705 [Glaciecola sp.]|jgi:hypothetical protein
MMKAILLIFVVSLITAGCSNETINIELRDNLISKIDTASHRKVPGYTSVVTLDAFFQGNFDDASFAPNIDNNHTGIQEIYKRLQEIRAKNEVSDIFVEITDVMFENEKSLGDKWPFSWTIYIVTSADDSTVLNWTKSLEPENTVGAEPIPDSIQVGKNQRVVTIWWD